ncbi:1952_t:CDS:2 [Ambispora leptoticha]|uniref:1952_t:CDS:1 n=1 Tax=Ambispora leptoticha TaxID=144679 RepID=A0A9N9DCY0_9GLOM|nr:1952_t:CDS:2 [Ambispora leptoticha]
MQSQPPPGFVLPNMSFFDHCWTGFWRSSEKVVKNRYIAKCFYCKCDLCGRSDKLHNHVLTYGNWPNSYSANDSTDSPSSPTLKCQDNLTNWIVKPISQDKQAKIDKKLLDAVIYGNLSFRIVKNPYFHEFLKELASNYCPPSAETLSTKILNNSFSTYLPKKFKVMSSLTDITVALDGWQNVSRNLIYGFIALKEEQEHVLEIINLSANRHIAVFLKEKLRAILKLNSVLIKSVIACVTDNPVVMVKMRNDLKEKYPNIIPTTVAFIPLTYL